MYGYSHSKTNQYYMKNRVKNIVFDSIALMAILVLATSCQHKDLCYYHPHVAPVKVKVDWEKANGNASAIDGMTAHLFAMQELDQKISTTVTTHQVNEIVFDVLEGEYSVAVFNGIPEEYTSLSFYDLGNYRSSSVQVKETNVPWYSKYKVKSNDKYVAHQPEWIARGIADDITVTKEMVETAEQEYIDAGFKMSARNVNLVGDVVPDSLVCTFKIRVILQGIDNYYQARAVVSGLAIGKQIISGEALDESVSHYAGMESWKLVGNSMAPDGKGEIQGTITCFGVPAGFRGIPDDIKLTLEVMLVDKQTIITYEKGAIPIGHLVKREGNGINLYMTEAIPFPEPLPYVKPEDGEEGGFGVGIEDWEKEEIEILNH